MTLFKNSGQSSATAGTALDVTNGALPDAPSVIVPGAGGAITIENDATSPGTKCIQVTPASGVASYWGYTGMSGATNQFTMRGLWKSPAALPGAFTVLFNTRTGGGGSPIGSLALTSGGLFQVVADSAGTSSFSGSAITANTWYDLSIQCENPTASTGVMKLTVRDLSGSTLAGLSAVHGGALGAGTANFGTGTTGTVRLGLTTAGTLGATRFKYWSFQTGTSTELPQPGANATPTVSPIAAKIQSGSSATSFTAVPADTDGTITTHAWAITKPDGTSLSTGVTGNTTATVTIANQATAGSYKVDYTATDDGGATATTSTWLFVAAASGVGAKPYKVQSNAGTWTYGGTATSIVDGLRGTDALKWIISPDAPAGNSIVLNMEVPTSGHYALSFYIDWVASDGTTSVTGVTGPITGQVFQGTTAITTPHVFTQTGSGPLLCSFDFTTLEDTALSTDLKDIRVELIASQ